MVAELIGAGCTPDVAASVVARAFLAGVESSGCRVDKTIEKRREWDREYRRNKREQERLSGGIHPTPPDVANTPLSSLSKDNRKRGARLDVGWTPSDADRAFAEQLGWSSSQIDSEAANFRDYWTAKPGTGAVKLDWPATWRKWIRSSKVKPAGNSGTVQPLQRNWEAAASSWFKFRTWPKGHGNDPDSPACPCPREILDKYRGAA